MTGHDLEDIFPSMIRGRRQTSIISGHWRLVLHLLLWPRVLDLFAGIVLYSLTLALIAPHGPLILTVIL